MLRIAMTHILSVGSSNYCFGRPICFHTDEEPFVLVRLVKMRQTHAVWCVLIQNERLYQPEMRIKPHESMFSRRTDWLGADFRPK